MHGNNQIYLRELMILITPKAKALDRKNQIVK